METTTEGAERHNFNKGRYITVDEFRQRFFSERCRPSRSEVVAWIADGLGEIRLRGIELNGKTLVDSRRVDEFFSALSAGASRPRQRRDDGERTTGALETLREKFGVKC